LAEEYYVKDGQPTGKVFAVRVAIRFLRERDGSTRAPDFGLSR
jgi:hypothetical protein